MIEEPWDNGANQVLGAAFRDLYSSYAFLRDHRNKPDSEAWKLLQGIANNNIQAYLKCCVGMAEGHERAVDIVRGSWNRSKRTPRENLLLHLGRYIEGPALVYVGLKVPYDENLPEFVVKGYGGTRPAEVLNSVHGCDTKDNGRTYAIALLESALVGAGNLLRGFNNQLRHPENMIFPDEFARKLKDFSR